MQTETGKRAMSEPSEIDQPQYAEEPHQAAGGLAPHATRPQGAPALRIGRVHEAKEPEPELPPALLPGTLARAPWYLRLLRLAVGLTLLVLAWCGVLIVDLLADSALRPIRPDHPTFDTAIAVLKFAGACWIGIATLASIIAGAFSLLLALTNRDWR